MKFFQSINSKLNNLFIPFNYITLIKNYKTFTPLKIFMPLNKLDNLIFLSSLAGSLVLINACYVYSSLKTEEVKIIKKYNYVSYGITKFMVIDENSRHFNISNSIWVGYVREKKEHYYSIVLNDKIRINYYGIWSKFLNINPVIFDSNSEYNKYYNNKIVDSNYKLFEAIHWLVI